MSQQSPQEGVRKIGVKRGNEWFSKWKVDNESWRDVVEAKGEGNDRREF